MSKKVAILISGGGSNMVALVKSMTGDHPARAAVVISNTPQAAGLQRAADLAFPQAFYENRPYGKTRPPFEAFLDRR